MARDYFASALPRLFGHRGAAGVAPENTMPSFERAVAAGVGYLELDVHATRDGTVVALHDATLDRTTDATGRVRNRTLEDLHSIDAGYRFEQAGSFPSRGREIRIPTLLEVLQAF